MAKLIYGAIASLDGYIEDERGMFDWAVPDEEVHAFINDRQRSVGTYLYGRRMYETMLGWETDHTLADHSPIMRDFAQIWQSATKIVYSTTLATAATTRTRIERAFDPTVVRQMLAAADRDIEIGGPTLAQHAFTAGLVAECHLYLVPILIGSGKHCLPSTVRRNLELLNVRQFANGMLYLCYHVDT